MSKRLDEKVVIITGAAKGQGRAAAFLFAREGAKVVVADYDEKAGKATTEEVQKEGLVASFFQVDVSNEEQMKALVQYTVETYGKLDVMYHNAGISTRPLGDGNRIENVTDYAWERGIAVLLKAPYLACKYAIPEMIKIGGGSIIITSSTAGYSGGMPIGPYKSQYPTGGPIVYTAAKSGILSMAKALAVTYGPDQIRVNVICPGPINTELMAPLNLDQADVRQSIENAIPLRRLGECDDIANMALYLASDESTWVTGNVLKCEGGLTAY